jgi:hypothetical protein
MRNPIFPKPNQQASENIVNVAKAIEAVIDPSVLDSHSNDSLTNAAREFGETDEVKVEPINEIEFPVDLYELDPVSGSAIGDLMDKGFDAIAFYKSFRHINCHPAPGYWGIFYIKPRVALLINEMMSDTGLAKDECLDSILRFLYGHEIYHYKIDAICLQKEAFSNYLIYRPYRNYVNSLSIADWYEESLANHYGLAALESFNSHRGFGAYKANQVVKQFMSELVEMSPGAYQLGLDRNVLGLLGARGLLAQQIVQGCPTTNAISKASLKLSKSTFFQQLLLEGYKNFKGDRFLAAELSLTFCPVNWITWYKNGSVVCASKTVPLKEIKEGFIKNYLSGEQKRLTDHEYFKIDNGELVKVPNGHDKDIRLYELKNIIEKAGMQNTEFWAARNLTNKWKKSVPREVIKSAR